MARAPFQVLILPWRWAGPGQPEFAIFQRADDHAWQVLAGGGEDDETPLAAAVREAYEEAGIPASSTFIALTSVASIPVYYFRDSEHWGDDLFVIPEYSFGVQVSDGSPRISDEHRDIAWLPYREASNRLTWDSNRIALWELHQRILGLGPRDAVP